MKVAQSCPTLRPHGLYRPWNSPGQNTGVGSLPFCRGTFPTQGSNPSLLHCKNLKRHNTLELTKEKESHRLRQRTYGCWEEGIVRDFGIHMYTMPNLKHNPQGPPVIAHGTLLNVMWQPGWEGSLGENGYMYMYG